MIEGIKVFCTQTISEFDDVFKGFNRFVFELGSKHMQKMTIITLFSNSLKNVIEVSQVSKSSNFLKFLKF